MRNKLIDLLQGASNAAASNISAPVDGVAWLLRKAGLNVQNPVGGSDWMAQRGLTREPQNRLAGILGESLGGVAPLLAAAKAPQIARGVLQGADNLMAPRTLNPQTGAIVWHGSPHKFDKFDSSKIGTGEGAQAYGHGLYLAENPSVAREYQEKLSSVGGAKNLVAQYGDIDKGIAEAQKRIAGYKQLIADGGGGDARRATGMLNLSEKNLQDLLTMKAGLPDNTGALYKVDLPDEHIAKMLDWDKPLSQQHPDVQVALSDPQVKTAVLKLKQSGQLGDYSAEDLLKLKGEDWHDILRQANGDSNVSPSSFLQSRGIPGIRYLDGGSRGAGTGSSNFVVFPGNESMLSIMERNGKPVNALKSMKAR
jgi:hypothetical protein